MVFCVAFCETKRTRSITLSTVQQVHTVFWWIMYNCWVQTVGNGMIWGAAPMVAYSALSRFLGGFLRPIWMKTAPLLLRNKATTSAWLSPSTWRPLTEKISSPVAWHIENKGSTRLVPLPSRRNSDERIVCVRSSWHKCHTAQRERWVLSYLASNQVNDRPAVHHLAWKRERSGLPLTN